MEERIVHVQKAQQIQQAEEQARKAQKLPLGPSSEYLAVEDGTLESERYVDLMKRRVDAELEAPIRSGRSAA